VGIFSRVYHQSVDPFCAANMPHVKVKTQIGAGRGIQKFAGNCHRHSKWRRAMSSAAPRSMTVRSASVRCVGEMDFPLQWGLSQGRLHNLRRFSAPNDHGSSTTDGQLHQTARR
jgi:hypothetical protein